MAKKTMQPAPVYIARYGTGAIVRMSFTSLENKPLDLARGRKLCDLVRASAEFDAGPGAEHVKKIKDNAARAEAKLADRIEADYLLLGKDKAHPNDTLEQFKARRQYSADYGSPVTAVEGYIRAKAAFVRSYQAPASTIDHVYHPAIGLQSIADLAAPAEKPKPVSKDKARIVGLESQISHLGALLDQVRLEIAECIDADATLARISDLIGHAAAARKAA